VFQLKASANTRQFWDRAFTAELKVTAANRQLETALTVTNTDQQPFTFTGALHTYLRVEDIRQVAVEGLQGISCVDSSDRQTRLIQKEKELRFNGEVDRFYINASQRLSLHTPERLVEIEMEGFRDVVIWNPWIEGCAALPDLEPQAYLEMLCVEAAMIENPVTLQPAQTWTGIQRLIA
jgi:glucose-6-phosphate 1-epimerase